MTDLKNADEFIDEALLGVGVKFTDETQNKTERKACGNAAPKWEAPAPDAGYEPVADYAPTFYDRLKGCAKWAVPFGALFCLIFYWQQAGLMAPEAAVPSMCACTLLVGWGAGRNAKSRSPDR